MNRIFRGSSTYPTSALLSLLVIPSTYAGVIQWRNGGGVGDNGTGSGPGADPSLYTEIGNGTGINEWNVGAGINTATTVASNAVITNTFNSAALTDGFDFDVTVDMSQQTMVQNETYDPGGAPGSYLHDWPAVNPWLDGNGGAAHSLGIRVDSSSGTMPAGNNSVAYDDLIDGTSTWADLTPEIISVVFDHKGFQGMTDVIFQIHEIGINFGDPVGNGNWDHESVIITGLGVDGNTYDPTITAVVPGDALTPDISGNTARGVNGITTHNFDEASINVDFGSNQLDSVTIVYEMRRRTDIGNASFGIGIGDIAFTSIVPEPSGISLLILSAAGLLTRRQRRSA